MTPHVFKEHCEERESCGLSKTVHAGYEDNVMVFAGPVDNCMKKGQLQCQVTLDGTDGVKTKDGSHLPNPANTHTVEFGCDTSNFKRLQVKCRFRCDEVKDDCRGSKLEDGSLQVVLNCECSENDGDTYSDICNSFRNPCKNGGKCSALGESALCKCQPGYEGPTCTVETAYWSEWTQCQCATGVQTRQCIEPITFGRGCDWLKQTTDELVEKPCACSGFSTSDFFLVILGIGLAVAAVFGRRHFNKPTRESNNPAAGTMTPKPQFGSGKNNRRPSVTHKSRKTGRR